ncbi:hypothetical protein INR49_011265 [Caranx melampygus]|nr:hypothetical protein INR49_011265 [Caranx melampygus]
MFVVFVTFLGMHFAFYLSHTDADSTPKHSCVSFNDGCCCLGRTEAVFVHAPHRSASSVCLCVCWGEDEWEQRDVLSETAAICVKHTVAICTDAPAALNVQVGVCQDILSLSSYQVWK